MLLGFGSVRSKAISTLRLQNIGTALSSEALVSLGTVISFGWGEAMNLR